MTDETKQLEPYAEPFAILGPEAEEYLDILEENTGSRKINVGALPVWKFPRAAGEEWIYEDETGGRQREAALTGVVLAQRRERTFYRDKYAGGGTPPDCRSNDGVTGSPLMDDSGNRIDSMMTAGGEAVFYGGACASCPMSQWESKQIIDPSYNGSGQACAEYRFLVIQRPSEPTPEGVRLPPSALRTWEAFGDQISRARTRLSALVISLGLDLPKGRDTADLEVTAIATVPRETAAQLRAIAPDVKRPQLIAPTELSPENEAAVAEAVPY